MHSMACRQSSHRESAKLSGEREATPHLPAAASDALRCSAFLSDPWMNMEWK
jgi:hypothetical protein